MPPGGTPVGGVGRRPSTFGTTSAFVDARGVVTMDEREWERIALSWAACRRDVAERERGYCTTLHSRARQMWPGVGLGLGGPLAGGRTLLFNLMKGRSVARRRSRAKVNRRSGQPSPSAQHD